ncbi:MAG: hypothetical protein H6832_19040 [Planctomycetes bacterium]|nr:hypothetical protein [Planctomycetota bacterium]MCB9920506.1 hypothetical protein [Planctomycetota bacterium]
MNAVRTNRDQLLRVAVILLGAASTTTASTTLAQERSTRIRVVDFAEAKPVAGATVHAVTSPFPHLIGNFELERAEATTDERGSARLELDPSRIWTIWATKRDGATERFASLPSVGHVVGRPLRLELEPFPVDCIVLENLDAWRKLLDGDKRLTARITGDRPDNWLGYLRNSQSEFRAPVIGPIPAGFVAPEFVVALDDTASSSFVLPPLPLGFFFVELQRANGDVLDVRWIMHLLRAANRNAPGYDFDARKKTLFFSGMQKVEVRATTQQGEPVRGLRIAQSYPVVRSPRVRYFETGADGTATAFVPSINQGSASDVQLQVFDPRFSNRQVRSIASGTFSLIVGPPAMRRATIEGLAKGDALYYTEAGRAVRVSPDTAGSVHLPAAGSRASWSLLAVVDDRGVVLADDASALNGDFQIDVASYRDVEVTVRGRGGNPVTGGFVEVLAESEGDPPIGLRSAIDAQGIARIRVRPGTYHVLGWNERRGDGMCRIVVPESPPPGRIQNTALELDAFRVIRGRVLRATQPLPGGFVDATTVAPTDESLPSIRLASFSSRTARIDEQGRFEFDVSSRAANVSLNIYDDRGGTTGRVVTNWTPATEGDLVVEMQ